MRIALVITELYPGGAERCLTNLAIYLHRRGHEVRVLSLWSLPPPGRQQCIDALRSEGIPADSVGWDRWWQTPAGLLRLKRRLAAFRPDVTQAFLFHANVACAWACRKLPSRLFGGARVVQPSRWRRALQNRAARRMRRLVCVSRSVADSCHRSEGIPLEKLTVIPNGIDLDSIDSATGDWTAFGLPESARVILYVGRLDPQKGLVEMLDHADAMLRELPDHYLILMGEGPLASTIERRMAASRCSDRMRWVGWRPDALGWMRSADMLVLPAKYEGMPNVVLEAMAVGRPVVTFDVEGIGEVFGDSFPPGPQVVPAGDYASFVRSVIQIAVDRDLQQRLGENNARRIAEKFSLDVQMQAYLELYTDLPAASAHRNGPP